jgi:hypothetical protein
MSEIKVMVIYPRPDSNWCPPLTRQPPCLLSDAGIWSAGASLRDPALHLHSFVCART